MTNIKLLFTCLHNGTEERGIVRDEAHLPNTCTVESGQGFSTENDILTSALTKSISNNILKLSGKEPYTEIGTVDRKYVDLNRKEECAFEQSSLQAKQAYAEYHNRILLKIEEMLPQNEDGMAFLFDIHGTELKKVQGRFIEVIIGTDEGNSIQALTEVDPNAFWGAKGLIPLLEGKGIRVFPRNSSQQMQDHILDGGHTIQTYGSSRFKKGLVAIQVEVIHSIRDDRYCRVRFAADMANCILKFVSPFI
jgi:hypothetical protein